MGEASEMSGMSEVSTAADAGKGGAAGGGSKGKILVPVVILLLLLGIAGALLITGSSSDEAEKKSSESGDGSSGGEASGSGPSSGGGSSDPPPPTPPPTGPITPKKLLFCFVHTDGDVTSGLQFPDDDLCTHIIWGVDSFNEIDGKFLLPSSYNDFEDMFKSGAYKKTEGGLSMDYRRITSKHALTKENLKVYFESKLVHTGLHFVNKQGQGSEYNKRAVNYLKSIYDYQKEVAPERLLGKSDNPLYGFFTYIPSDYDPSKPEKIGELFKQIEEHIKFPLLFVLHTSAEKPLDDTECVLGGTPYKLPAICKKFSMDDYLKLAKTLTFSIGSRIAASFSLGVMRYGDVGKEVTESDKVTELRKDRGMKPDQYPFNQVCDPDEWPTQVRKDPEGAMAATVNKDKKQIFVYEGKETIQYKVKPFGSQSTGAHVGFVVFYAESDQEDCDSKPYQRLAKIRDVTHIRRQ